MLGLLWYEIHLEMTISTTMMTKLQLSKGTITAATATTVCGQVI